MLYYFLYFIAFIGMVALAVIIFRKTLMTLFGITQKVAPQNEGGFEIEPIFVTVAKLALAVSFGVLGGALIILNWDWFTKITNLRLVILVVFLISVLTLIFKNYIGELFGAHRDFEPTAGELKIGEAQSFTSEEYGFVQFVQITAFASFMALIATLFL